MWTLRSFWWCLSCISQNLTSETQGLKMKLDICLSWMLKEIGPGLLKSSQPWSKSCNCSAFKIHCKHLSLVLAVEPGLLQGLSCNAACMEFSRLSFQNLCHNCICKEVVLGINSWLADGFTQWSLYQAPGIYRQSRSMLCLAQGSEITSIERLPSPTPASELLCHSLLTETHIFLTSSLCSGIALIVLSSNTRKWLARANSKTGCEQSPDDCREFKKLRKQAGITFSPFTSSIEIYLGGHFFRALCVQR